MKSACSKGAKDKLLFLFQGTAVGCIINHAVMAYATYVWQLYIGKVYFITLDDCIFKFILKGNLDFQKTSLQILFQMFLVI